MLYAAVRGGSTCFEAAKPINTSGGRMMNSRSAFAQRRGLRRRIDEQRKGQRNPLACLEEAEANELSNSLRRGRERYLGSRRIIFGLYGIATASLGVIAAYQLGILPRLPEPSSSLFNSERVTSSPEAYRLFSAPDAALGMGSYATTMLLAAMGPAERWRRHSWLPLAMGGKMALDAINAGRLTASEWKKHRSLCSWCLLSAAITVAALPFAIGEGRAAW